VVSNNLHLIASGLPSREEIVKIYSSGGFQQIGPALLIMFKFC